MKETVGQSNPEDLEASRPETKSGIADELAENRKDATSSSRDISTRIPKIDLSKLGFQGVVVTPEDRVAMVKEDAIPEQVPWLHKLALLRQLKAPEDDLNTSNDVSGFVRATIDNIAKRLSKEVLQLEAQRLFEYPGAARAFDKLLTRFAIESGQLDQLVTELKLREYFDVRLLAIIKINPSFVNDNYKFSKALLGSGTSQPNCMKIIELHADALASAQDRLREAEETLKAHFDENLQRCIEQGIIPASAQPAAGSPRETRYKALAVLASDPVSNSLAHKGGQFGLTDNVIQIDASIVLTDNLDGIYDHERLHALSGATVILDGTDEFDQYGISTTGDEWSNEADVQQVFDKNTDDGKVQPDFLLKGRRIGLSSKFDDINEAYTEWAAMQLRGDSYDQGALWQSFNELYAKQILSENNLVIGDDQEQRGQWKKFVEEYGGIYLEYRIMMAGLVHAGVDMLVLGEAYFESYEPKRSNPDREPGNAAPARWALDRAIAEHTPYKSLEQLQNALDVLAKERLGPIARKNTRWYKAALLSELLQPGTK